VALLTAAFFGGMLTVRRHQPAVVEVAAGPSQPTPDKDRERVFLGAMSDHLDRSEILVAQLLHATPGELDSKDERARARDLVEENRLLRETASRSGDRAHAALLDDLERVFLDLANSPGQLSSEDVDELRRRVENQGLLFKVRVTSTDARSKGQTL
jgi:polyhydroxyalkanoate synthesis regulator phasin